MTVVCLGTSHRTAPVDFLERALDAAHATRTLLTGAAGRAGPVDEFALLGTCNRVELYAAGSPGSAETLLTELRERMAASLDLPSGLGWSRVFYEHTETGAVRHLCRVAAGLDSLVVGEHEIAGQVSRAFDEVVAREGADTLRRVARAAKTASARARAETGIARGPASISSVAADLVGDEIGSLSEKRVLVVGAGKMSRLACDAFLRLGAGEVRILSRTLDSARALARGRAAVAVTWKRLPEEIRDADVVFSATSAPGPVITRALLREARDEGSDRALVIVDVAVPRDVEPEATELSGVRLFDIDDLRSRIDAHLHERRGEIPRAEAIVEEEVAAYEDRSAREPLLAVVQELRNRAEGIRRRELDRALRELGDLDPEVRDRVERLSRSLVNRLLHQPTERLRTVSGNGRVQEYHDLARDLFGLVEDARAGRSRGKAARSPG